ncbi:MAG: hypothetical protein Q7R92_00035 [bacterium]|nr:hypothetical protein [bacterium]
MLKDESQPRRRFRKIFYVVLLCLTLASLVLLLVDGEDIISWSLQRSVGGEFGRYRIEAITESGKVICLGEISYWDRDGQIKKAAIRVREVDVKERREVIDLRKILGWPFK